MSRFLKPKSHCNLEVRALVEEQELIITVAKDLQAPPFSVMLLEPVTLTQVITRSHQIYTVKKNYQDNQSRKILSAVLPIRYVETFAYV